MCAHGEYETVVIKGRAVKVDRCLAPIVKALNDGGIDTGQCCCGHGEGDGFIMALYNGQYRLLVAVSEGQESLDRMDRDFLHMAERWDNLRRKKEMKPVADKMVRSTETK